MKPLRLHEFEARFSLLLDAGTTAVDDAIEAAGHEPNGYFWEGVAELIVATKVPELAGRFQSDPEGGMYCAIGSERDVLEQLGQQMAKVANDPAELHAIIELAAERGFVFDD